MKLLASLCLSVFGHMEQLDSYWTDFHEICCLSVFRNYVEKIKVTLKLDKSNVNFS